MCGTLYMCIHVGYVVYVCGVVFVGSVVSVQVCCLRGGCCACIYVLGMLYTFVVLWMLYMNICTCIYFGYVVFVCGVVFVGSAVSIQVCCICGILLCKVCCV